jgi:hypothetical protein
VNVWAGFMHKLIGPIFFSEKTVTERSYLTCWRAVCAVLLPPQTILQQDGVPPHFCNHVKNHLDREDSSEIDRQRWTNRLVS